jgi:SAM-dependent methyltransferase
VDPLAGSSWSAPATVAGFARSTPNPVLLQFAQQELRRVGAGRALDIGCGAARNAVPLANLGWQVLGTDLSWPMVGAAMERASAERVGGAFHAVLAPMERLPVRDRTVNLLVAHGIWNLARSGDQFRTAVRDAARAAAPGAALFVFTFSRHTFPEDVRPVAGETFVFTQFSGEPQCFLTERQLDEELARAGFVRDPAVPLREYNRAPTDVPAIRSTPVIYEAAYRRVA